MDPLRACTRFFEEHQPGQRAGFLVAVSGGVDSMVLCDVFLKLEIPFAVAHCNFGLRGRESDADEWFVRDYCANNRILFFSRLFDTNAYMQRHKKGVQEAARELRYSWFDTVCAESGFQWIVTAHHKNDQAETIIMNMARGAGIRGMRGMLPVNGKILRPLLQSAKEDITGYAELNGIAYRTDSSNLKTDYTRNKVRHLLIPELSAVNKNAVDHLTHLGDEMQALYLLLSEAVHTFTARHLVTENARVLLPVAPVKAHPLAFIFLFEILRKYRFNRHQVRQVFEALDKGSGARFYSETHCLLKDRGQLIITVPDKEGSGETSFFIDEQTGSLSTPDLDLSFELHEHKPARFEPGKLYLDAALMSFPIVIRRWEHGDKMKPLGMTGSKKISDILVDEKVSLDEKDHTYVVLSGPDIIALINHRIDDRYKVSASSTRVFCITSLH